MERDELDPGEIALATIEPEISRATLTGHVLCVDLDGSLLATDLLWESFAEHLRTRPWEAPLVVSWLAKGKANLKRELACRTSLDASTLPYNEKVIEYIKARRAEGDRIVLATAADEDLARKVADHVGLFDEVIASDGSRNLKGHAKLAAIHERFGAGNFDYIGNGPEDLSIWEAASQVIVVEPDAKLARQVQALGHPGHVFDRDSGRRSAWPKLLRVHQWSKNLLLFVPLITAHELTNWPLMFSAIKALLAFCFGASSIYLINDLIDLPSDRVHVRKRHRPMASGAISIPAGIVASVLLLTGSIGLSALTSPAFLTILLVYLTTSMSYTFFLKRKMLMDVLCLAGLYTLRILAGGAATGIEISAWLMAFSMFLFLSLAFLKRFTELSSLASEKGPWLPGRGYQKLDLDMIRSVGPASGYLSVLVVCLYLNDQQSSQLYHHPKWLLLLCPVVLYWITRVWFLGQRGQMHSDPIVFALRDRRSLIAGLVCGAIIAAATLL